MTFTRKEFITQQTLRPLPWDATLGYPGEGHPERKGAGLGLDLDSRARAAFGPNSDLDSGLDLRVSCENDRPSDETELPLPPHLRLSSPEESTALKCWLPSMSL